MGLTFDILLTAFLVLLNGFFVAAEFAIVKVRGSQLELQAQKGNRFAQMGKHIVSHLDAYLAATQLGITLASLGLGWIGEPVVSKVIVALMTAVGISLSPDMAHAIALPTAFAIITILHIVFGELAPKSIAIQRSEMTTLSVAYPLHFFFLVFKPFIWLLNGVANLLLGVLGVSPTHGSEIHSSEELKYLVQQGQESGTIATENFSIIKNAFDFSDRTVNQIMVPRSQVLAINLGDGDEMFLEKLFEEGYSRIPCYDGSLDTILGVVYLKDILMNLRKETPSPIRDLMRPVLVVPESKRIGQLMRDFQKKHQQIAVVVSEFGGTEGIVTMEDILEELVGEIQDEFDTEVQLVEKVDAKTLSVFATISLHDLNRSLPRPIPPCKEYQTLAGFLLHKLGRIPNTNERITAEEFEFTILKRSKSSIILVLVKDLAKGG